MTGHSARGQKPGLRRRRLLQAGLAASAAGAAGTAAACRAAAATERSPATIAELRALPPGEIAQGAIVPLAGYHAPGDGGGGEFRFAGASTAPDDGGLVLKPTGHEGAGRWLRLVSGLSLSPKWFGARGGGRAPAAAQVQAALDAARGRYLVDIDDSYLIEATLVLRHDGQAIAGPGTLTGAIAAFPRITGNAPAEMKDRYGEGSYAVASLAAEGSTITATTARPHNFRSGDRVAVFFALPDSYCGIQPIAVTGERSFTYRAAAAPDRPATLYGALCCRIDYPPPTAPRDPVAATGGACFRPQGDVTKVEIRGVTIANFRYAALMSGPDVAEPSRVAAVNMLVFDHVTFDNVNICGFGYPFIQGGSFLDCTYREVNCIACGNAVCLPEGHPYAGTDTQFVVLLSLDNRSGLEQRLRLNANLDLWFYESVLRPETASVNPQGTSVWFMPFRRGKDKMPPSQAAVSGHAVYCPSRSASRQYQATIKNLNTIDSYRSLVVFGQPSYLLMDCLGTETYVAPMPGEPLVHLVVAYGPEGNIPFGSEGVLRRIQNFLFGNPASKSVEIDRIRYDESGFIARAGDPLWLAGTPPSGLIAIDCETPNDCAMQLGNGILSAAGLALTPRITASAPARRGVERRGERRRAAADGAFRARRPPLERHLPLRIRGPRLDRQPPPALRLRRAADAGHHGDTGAASRQRGERLLPAPLQPAAAPRRLAYRAWQSRGGAGTGCCRGRDRARRRERTGAPSRPCRLDRRQPPRRQAVRRGEPPALVPYSCAVACP